MAQVPTVLETLALTPGARENPYPRLETLRAHCPVHRDEQAGVFFITGHTLARSILTDRTLLKDPDTSEPSAFLVRFRRMGTYEGLKHLAAARMTILDSDDPSHQRVREPMAKALYARVARFRGDIERITDEFIARLDGKDEFDLVSEFAIPVPVDVIAAILGVERERLAEFRDWSEGVVLTFNHARTPEQTAYVVRSSNAIGDFMYEALADRRVHPKDDLVTDMARLQAEGADLSDDEICANLCMLLVGGNLTTSDLISNSIRLLLEHPAEREKLQKDPSLISGVVEEVLRFDGPVDLTVRVAPREMNIGGCPVRPSQAFGVSLRGANRDPKAFPNPDAFDVARNTAGHLAFGGGSHICLGAPLARMEAQVAIMKVLQRFPKIRLAKPEEELQWRSVPTFRGLARFDVRVD